MSASTSISHPSSTALTGRLAAGAAGGLAGGVVFGILMQLDDMIPMVAMLVDLESVAVGWVVHLAISVFLGALFAVVIGHRGGGLARSVGLGAACGVQWWVLDALVLMPARLGMDLFMLNEENPAQPHGPRDLRGPPRCRRGPACPSYDALTP